MSENVILTGFMGTGKSTVGKVFARQLGCQFVDMDDCISEQLGKPINRIFLESGEAAFRNMENDLCERLSQEKDLVISTGGGTLINQNNRRILEKTGRLICLNADVEVLLQRIQKADDPVRPLINSGDKQISIRRLLAERETAYQAIPWQIDTTHLDVDQVIDRVSVIANAVKLNVVHPASPYPVWIGSGILEHCGDLLFQACAPRGSNVAIVSNSTVASHYASIISQKLDCRGYQPFLFTMGDGEKYKSLDTVASLYEQFLSSGINREDTIIALGGGIVGDVSGFAAASYLRGIRFVQIPTSLLAMIDSSIGGKTGVNLPQGKNLVGAFKQPGFVLIDPITLKTLPEAEIRAGLAEIIKHGLIADPALFESLEKSPGDVSMFWQKDCGASMIAKAVKVKITFVEEDPYEQGSRIKLNLGHTIGHAIERVSRYKLRHGEAVSIGMIAAAALSSKMKISKTNITERLQSVLHLWKLPVECPPFPVEEIIHAMDHDKKKKGRKLQWILPEAIGKVDIASDIPVEMVKKTLMEMGAK